MLGKAIEPSRFYDRGYEFGFEDMGSIEWSRWGVPTVEDGLLWRTLNFKLSWLTEAEYRASFAPLAANRGKRKVAFWCFDPTANAYRQDNCYLAWFKQAPPFAQAAQKPGSYAMEFSILSLI